MIVGQKREGCGRKGWCMGYVHPQLILPLLLSAIKRKKKEFMKLGPTLIRLSEGGGITLFFSSTTKTTMGQWKINSLFSRLTNTVSDLNLKEEVFSFCISFLLLMESEEIFILYIIDKLIFFRMHYFIKILKYIG